MHNNIINMYLHPENSRVSRPQGAHTRHSLLQIGAQSGKLIQPHPTH